MYIFEKSTYLPIIGIQNGMVYFDLINVTFRCPIKLGVKELLGTNYESFKRVRERERKVGRREIDIPE